MIPIRDDNPTTTFPFVTISLIVINAAVFVYELILGRAGGEAFIYRSGAIPYEITHLSDIYPAAFVPPPFTLFTAIFVHAGLLHVAGNMLFLWIFGDNIEDRLGHLKFIVFYLLTGLVASLAHILANPHATLPMVGASGAIAGVLGAYFLLFPRSTVHTLVFFFFFVNIVKIPAVFFLGFWFLIQVLSSGAAGSGGIAWYAHIGGFVAGVALIKLFRPKRPQRIFHTKG